MSSNRPRVLLTNDDGPPGHESPYIFALSVFLQEELGWHVRVVVPSSQKSWIGKAFQIKEIVKGRYYYPTKPDGAGETSEISRPLREGEVAEWILLDGTPATCANVAIHNLYPGEIDLVISGPNFGRNTSSAFALSSGTIGAAMSAALARKRAIALSYGTFLYPTPTELHGPAHRLAALIITRLWNNWGTDPIGIRGDGEVDLYNVNIPMVQKLLSDDGVSVTWSTMWRNSYGRLFARHLGDKENTPVSDVSAGGPDADPTKGDGGGNIRATGQALVFKFSPDMQPLIRPNMDTLPEDTDTWAVHNDFASVTPLRAAFAEPPAEIGMAFQGETADRSQAPVLQISL
ncbi:sure-like protein [Hysterangium stoloniferum]|nr:sure-like protein [Hysterangium stoloniferum]